jgi:hypothetical protein
MSSASRWNHTQCIGTQRFHVCAIHLLSLFKDVLCINRRVNLCEYQLQEWGIGQQEWQLDDASMKALGSMNDGHRYLWDPTDVT